VQPRPGDPLVLLPVKQLKAGQVLMLDLLFANPKRVPLRFTTAVLAGPGVV
jgi:hypothetical protein